MAFDHTTAGNDIGKIVRVWEMMDAICQGGAAYTADDIETIRAEWLAVMDADDAHLDIYLAGDAILQDLANVIQNMKTAWVEGVFKRWINVWLRDRSDLNSTSRTFRGIIGDWYDQMVTDSKVVEANTVAVGTVTPNGNNVGSGTIFVSEKDVWGNDNETIQAEDQLFVCVQDYPNSGVTAGREVFSWAGNISGLGPLLYVTHAEGGDDTHSNRITNGDFEDFTVADTPDSWDVDSGTVGTHILDGGADKYMGSKCLEIAGDGAQATIQISQTYSAWANYSTSKLEPKGVYCLSARVKTSGCGAGEAGDLTIQIAGTGISNDATTDIVISLDGNDSPPTSYTVYNRRVQLPKAINADTEIVVKVTDTLPSGNSVFVDNLIFAKMVEWPEAGTFALAIRGDTDFIAGDKQPDKFTKTSTNNLAKHLQTFLTRATDPLDPKGYRHPDILVHLPSSESASAEYAESKAT